jgi:sodium pump decarboxylase gamma subunit
VIAEGFELMVVGMGVVCAFLVLLVVVMTASGAFFTRKGLPVMEPEVATPASGGHRQASGDSARMAVALAAAHRARCGK